MDINITYGVGIGDTDLAAFDAALFDAGIANFNLIKLSSIIPPHANLIYGKVDLNNIDVGSKLYAVYTYHVATKQGESACAGLGWKYTKNYGGIFVEYSSNNYTTTHNYIESTLNSMNRYRHIKSENIIKIIESSYQKQSICSIIAALYKIENW